MSIFHILSDTELVTLIYFMNLKRHGCKLQVDWLAEAYSHKAVNLISSLKEFFFLPNLRV